MKENSTVYKKFQDGEKKFVPLVDPDKFTSAGIKKVANFSEKAGVAFIFFGGSLVTKNKNLEFLKILKENCSVPVCVLPMYPFLLSKARRNSRQHQYWTVIF